MSQASGDGLRDSQRGLQRKGHCHKQESTLVTEMMKQVPGARGMCQLPIEVRKAHRTT